MLNPYEIINQAMRTACARRGDPIGHFDSAHQHPDILFNINPAVLAKEIASAFRLELASILSDVERWRKALPDSSSGHCQLEAVAMLLEKRIAEIGL